MIGVLVMMVIGGILALVIGSVTRDVKLTNICTSNTVRVKYLDFVN